MFSLKRARCCRRSKKLITWTVITSANERILNLKPARSIINNQLKERQAGSNETSKQKTITSCLKSKLCLIEWQNIAVFTSTFGEKCCEWCSSGQQLATVQIDDEGDNDCLSHFSTASLYEFTFSFSYKNTNQQQINVIWINIYCVETTTMFLLTELWLPPGDSFWIFNFLITIWEVFFCAFWQKLLQVEMKIKISRNQDVCCPSWSLFLSLSLFISHNNSIGRPKKWVMR